MADLTEDGLTFSGYVQPPTVPPDPTGDSWRGEAGPPGPAGPAGPQGPQGAAGAGGVTTFNTRTGAVTLGSTDVTAALGFTPYNATNPAGYAPLASPAFTGTPTAPTATAGTNTTQLATTAFVAAAVVAGSSGVASFNTRTGAVTLSSADVTGALGFTPYNASNPAGYATLASPALTGTPTAPTAVGGTNTTQIASTAFVTSAVAASVVSFNARTGTVTLSSSDVTTALGYTPPQTLAGDVDVVISGPANGDRLRYNSTTSKWNNGREPYVVALFVPGTLTNAQLLVMHKCAQAVTFPSNFGAASSGVTSGGSCATLPTGACTLTVGKCLAASDPSVAGNWTAVGTISIAAGGNNATFSTTGAVSFASGDKLRVTNQATADATLGNLAITLAGDR